MGGGQCMRRLVAEAMSEVLRFDVKKTSNPSIFPINSQSRFCVCFFLQTSEAWTVFRKNIFLGILLRQATTSQNFAVFHVWPMHLKTLVDIFCGNWGKAPCKSCDSAAVMNLSVSFISSYFPGNQSILNVHQRLLFRRGFRRIHSTNLLKYQSRNNLCCYYARCKNRIVDFLVFAAFLCKEGPKKGR